MIYTSPSTGTRALEITTTHQQPLLADVAQNQASGRILACASESESLMAYYKACKCWRSRIIARHLVVGRLK